MKTFEKHCSRDSTVWGPRAVLLFSNADPYCIFVSHFFELFPPHLHFSVSILKEREKRQRQWEMKTRSTWLLFDVVSRALSALRWFNSCRHKHLLRALSRSQLRLTQPGTPSLIYAFLPSSTSSSFESFFFSPNMPNEGKRPKGLLKENITRWKERCWEEVGGAGRRFKKTWQSLQRWQHF